MFFCTSYRAVRDMLRAAIGLELISWARAETAFAYVCWPCPPVRSRRSFNCCNAIKLFVRNKCTGSWLRSEFVATRALQCPTTIPFVVAPS